MNYTQAQIDRANAVSLEDFLRTQGETLSNEVRAAIAELAALKFEVLQKVGEAVGNVQTYQL